MESVDSNRTGFLSSDWLLKVVDGGILAVILIAPLFMGGRGPVGKFVFVTLVSTTAVAWLIRQCLEPSGRWRWSGVEGLLAAGALLVALQVTPLPDAVLSVVSPHVEQLLPLWTGAGTAPYPSANWSTISLNPEATRGGLAVFFGYATLFLLVVQRLQTLQDVQRLLRWIGFGVLAMATLGLLQFLLSNGKFLWFYEHPSRTTFGVTKGTFHNQNHFAHFVALGVGPLIWMFCFWQAKSQARQLLAVGIGVVAFAGLLTFSRGGVIALGLAAAICIGIYFWKSLISKRAWIGVAAAGAVMLTALCIHGYEPLARRMASFGEARSLEELSSGREALWSALIEAIPHFVWVGSGVGTHRDVYPIFMDEYFAIEFSHGESGYLPLLLEAGVPGLLLMLTGLGVCSFWFARLLLTSRPGGETRSAPSEHNERMAAAGAVAPGLVVSAVHSIGDFVWYISACMSLTILLVACACRLFQLAESHRRSAMPADGTADGGTTDGGAARGLPAWALASLSNTFAGHQATASRQIWISVTVAVTLLAVGLIADRHRSAFAAPHYYNYVRLALPASQQNAAEAGEDQQLLEEMAVHLERAVAWNPHDARANLKLAAVELRLFELYQSKGQNPMPLSQFRDAALRSNFASREALDEWLGRAMGDNRFRLNRILQLSRRGLSACPLRGEGYLYLAQLSFLEGSSTDPMRAYTQQAQRVRPHSGMVHFAVGAEALLEDQYEVAVAHWKRAFEHDPEVRTLIVNSFANLVPPSFFLENFTLDGATLDRLFTLYSRQNPEHAKLVGQHYLLQLPRLTADAEPDVAARHWSRASRIHAYLGNADQHLACARKAVELQPQNLDQRRTLADACLQAELFAEAAEHYQWCVRRAPEDTRLAERLAEATRQRIRHQASTPRPDSSQGARF